MTNIKKPEEGLISWGEITIHDGQYFKTKQLCRSCIDHIWTLVETEDLK